MNSIPTWRTGCYQLFMPNPVLLTVGLILSLGASQAQAGPGGPSGYTVSNADADLSNADAWTPTFSAPPDATQSATWDDTTPTVQSSTGGNSSLDLDTFYTSQSLQSASSINIVHWNGTVMINTSGTAPTNSNVVNLTGNPAINTTGGGLDMGNLQVTPANGQSSTFALNNQLTITGALTTTAGDTTSITVQDSAPLNLVGSSNSGVATQTTGRVNLTESDGSTITLGNNQGNGANSKSTFGQLTVIGNTTLTEDYASSTTTPSAGNGFNNPAFAITQKTQFTFTGGLTFEQNTPNSTPTLTINGWQGTPGTSSVGGQLLFSNTDIPASELNTEITDVLFDLAGNNNGTKISPISVTGESSAYDYGEWITDISNPSLYELVPYAAVPEPKTVLAGLALLSLLGWRERRRLAGVYAHLLGRSEI